MARQAILNANASLYLDGNAGYFTVPITPDPTGFSFGMWIKTGKRTSGSTTVYMSSTSAAFTDGFAFSRAIGRGSIDFVGYNSTNSINSNNLNTGPLSDGVWAHTVVTYLPSGECKIYVNGQLANTVTATGTIVTGTTSIYVGRRSHGATFAGLNANQLVWHNTTTPWTAQQVQDLYNKGTIPTGATAVYPLSEGAGSIAYDTSGNGNNGTITSGTWTRDTPTKTRKLVNNNLVYNGDFEIAPPTATNVATTTGGRYVDGTAGGSAPSAQSVFGWIMWNYTGSYAAQFDYSVKRDGIASMKISTTATASTVGLRVSIHNDPSFKHNNIPVLPSTSYTASGWVKTSLISGSATTGARLLFVTSTGTGDVTTVNAVASIVTTTDWTQYSVTFTTAATARFITPVLQILGNDGAATLIMDAWFDDIQLYPTTPVTRNALTFARQPVDELVRNGDFEYAPAFTAATNTAARWIDGTAAGTDSTTGIYGWYVGAKGGSVATKFDTTEPITGTSSLKVSTLNTGARIEVYSFSSPVAGKKATLIPALPSTSYTLTYSMKTNYVSGDAPGVDIGIFEYNGAGTNVASTRSTAVKTTTSSTSYTLTKTTAATTAFIGIVIILEGSTGAGTLIMDAWFDNISLKLTTPTGRSAA
jgi:hypothetical protein